MQSAETVVDILRARGRRGLPCDELYRQLFNPALFLMAWGRIYANDGAMTPGACGETADGMSLAKIGRIIDALRHERYRFQPVRRVYIPKKNSGKKRPLGLPSWSDKLVGEVVRILLEAYYEPRFSGRSHGFRPGRGCHTALTEVAETWTGTTWFIEGDISDCFGSLDHEVMARILAEKIHDNRFLRLIKHMLRAGYLEDWQWNATLSGAPQGGVATPPTQKATSVSRLRWVTGGWSGAGERRGAGGAVGSRSGRVPARGGATGVPGGRAGRDRAGCLGSPDRRLAVRAGHVDGADDRVADRAGAGGGTGPVGMIMEQDEGFCPPLDIICSIFVSCLEIAARVPRSTRRTSTRPQSCWKPGLRPRRRHGCWPGGWAARSGRPAATSPRHRHRAGSR